MNGMSAGDKSLKFDSRLIRKPRQQPRLQRTLWGAVNVLFWAFLLYLWAPLLTVLSWLFGIRLAWRQLYEYQEQLDPFLLMALPVIFLCCTIGLIGWSEYNRRRFSGKERRRPTAAIDRKQIATDLGASPAVAAALATAKSIVVHMDDRARPIGFSSKWDDVSSPSLTHHQGTACALPPQPISISVANAGGG